MKNNKDTVEDPKKDIIEDRKSAYEAIKANNLQETVKICFGVNYTQVPTAKLWECIHTNCDPKPGSDYDIDKERAEERAEEEDEDIKAPLWAAIGMFLASLYDGGFLTEEEVHKVCRSAESFVRYSSKAKNKD